MHTSRPTPQGGGLSSRKTRKGTYSSDGGRGRQIKAQERSQEPPDRTRHSGKGPRKTAGSAGADGAPEQVRPAGARAAASTPAPQRPSGKDASVQVTGTRRSRRLLAGDGVHHELDPQAPRSHACSPGQEMGRQTRGQTQKLTTGREGYREERQSRVKAQ